MNHDEELGGQRLRQARVAAGITLREMAEIVGCTPGFLSRAERGQRPWPARLLAAYREELGLPEESGAAGRETSTVRSHQGELEITVLLLPDGGCDSYDQHWSFRAGIAGLQDAIISTGAVTEQRLYSFEPLRGGELSLTEERGKLTARLHFPPLKLGQRHTLAWREHPPSDLDTLTAFIDPENPVQKLRITVMVPPGATATYSLLRIDRVEPAYEWIPLELCEEVTFEGPEITVEFPQVEKGFSYGVHWDW